VPTDRQRSLFTAQRLLGASSRKRLKGTWAEGFRERVLPILYGKEEEFSELYSSTRGRPNWSIALMLGVLILKEMFNLSDQQALDSFSYDIRWQCALDVSMEEAYLSRRSFVGFRSRLVAWDPEMAKLREVFDVIGKTALDELGLSSSEQRIDSTRIVSNIRTGGRVALFRATLENFCRWLGKKAPEKLKLLSPELLAWQAEKRNGWFGAGSKQEQRRKLHQLAVWLFEVEQRFVNDETIHDTEPYQLVV